MTTSDDANLLRAKADLLAADQPDLVTVRVEAESLIETLRFVERASGPNGIAISVLPWQAGRGALTERKGKLTAFLAYWDAQAERLAQLESESLPGVEQDVVFNPPPIPPLQTYHPAETVRQLEADLAAARERNEQEDRDWDMAVRWLHERDQALFEAAAQGGRAERLEAAITRALAGCPFCKMGQCRADAHNWLAEALAHPEPPGGTDG